MPLNENDLSFFIDIIDCIFDINEFTNSIEYHQFEKDKMRRLAVERQLEVIGQAANKINIEAQNSLKNIPWKNIIGLRNNRFFGFYGVRKGANAGKAEAGMDFCGSLYNIDSVACIDK